MLVTALLLAAVPPMPTPTTRPAEDAGDPADRPRNLVVFVADGAGYATLEATRMWQGGPLTADGEGWRSVAVAPYALRGYVPCEGDAPDEQSHFHRYDPVKGYDATPAAGERFGRGDHPGRLYPRGFAGYEWHRETYPDSASTMSALMTGVTTYPGAINVDGNGEPVTSLAEHADAAGYRVGVVSSVPFNHATPASAAGTHARSRQAYHDLARQIFADGVVDVIAGPNDADVDDDAHTRESPSFNYVPEDLWAALKAGTVATDDGESWVVVRDTDDIQTLAAGDGWTPDKLAIVPRIHRTLQQKRGTPNGFERDPGADPKVPDLPTLADLTMAALNAVDGTPADPQPFVLVVEGGAVDWAMHANQTGRMIEEYQDFDAAIAAVSGYLDANPQGHSWDDTLVIVTADHDHLLFGPDAGVQAFQDLIDAGPGSVPRHRWFGDHHSNQLVPLFARGVGAEAVIALADEVDEAQSDGREVGRGPYFPQAKLGRWLIGQVRTDDNAAEPAD